MSTEDERPQPRARRRAPVPDPSEGQDPVTPRASPPPSPARGRARGGFRTADTYVQLNTRVDPLLSKLIEEVSSERRWSKRDVVEEALKTAYPEVFQMLQERHRADGRDAF